MAPQALFSERSRVSLTYISIVSLCLGLVTGFGAVAFRDLIGLVHNLAFLGKFSLFYDSSLFTRPSPWGAGVILVPVIGGVFVTWIVSTFAPEARGHGVPEVMDAIYYKRGIIRPVVAVAKSFASAVAIGTGAAVGREGPIIQIGSALGSTLGQILPIPASARVTLVAAGAGAGIAATFNTPIGGVLFAVELMLPEVSVDTFLPVAIATGTATFIGRYFFGDQPAFVIPAGIASVPGSALGILVLSLYAMLGGLAGGAAAAFVKVLHWFEGSFERIRNSYLRHAVGMLIVGGLFYGLEVAFGHYYVEGVGYSTIQSILRGDEWSIGLLCLLFLCKLAATTISLGSGSSGGVFSPSLFLGATIGGAFAALIGSFVSLPGVNIPAFAMVGMGAVVGGGTGAAMTAVTMIFEMTRDYGIVMPMIVAVAVSLGVRRILSRENIYTIKLVQRGHPIPKARHANMFLVKTASDIMERDVLVVPEDMPFEQLLAKIGDRGGMQHLVATKGQRITGVLRLNVDIRNTLSAAGPGVKVGDIVRRNFTIARDTDVAAAVINRLWRRKGAMAVVVGGTTRPRAAGVIGVITKDHIADAVAGSVEMYPR